MSEATRFFSAIKAGDGLQVKASLQAEPGLLRARDEAGVSAIMTAVYHGQKGIAQEFLERGVELDVWEASALGVPNRVEEILDQNAPAVNAVSPDGFTSLGLAAFFGQRAVIELLLARAADVNATSRNEMQVRPLHSAVAHRNPTVALAMAEMLLENGAEVNIAQSGGWTPLHQAAAHGHTEMVELLLHHGADPTARSDDARSPLDMALEGGHEDSAKLLRAQVA